MNIIFRDAVEVSEMRKTADGYLIADARCVRSGIQEYAGSEVGRPNQSVVRVYRPEDEVFSKDSVQSFSHAPLTMDLPLEPITADSWRKHAVGETSGEVMRDGEWLRIPLVVKDKAAIDAIMDGKRQLSAVYTCQLDFTKGTTPDGQQYDAIQRGIACNHVAIVARARAGSMARIGDSMNNDPQAIRDAARLKHVQSLDPNAAARESAFSDSMAAADGARTESTPEDDRLQAHRDGAYHDYVTGLKGGAQ